MMKQRSIYRALQFARAASLIGITLVPGCLVTNPPTSHFDRPRDFTIPRLSKWDPGATLLEWRQRGLYPAAISSPIAILPPTSIPAPVNK
jgi:hypothetical protein